MSEYRINWIHEGKEHFATFELTDKIEVVSHSVIDMKSRGLGDTIKKVVDKVSNGKIKQCSGCKKRQEVLNNLIPYKDNNNG
mgnify:FL=1